MNNLFIIQVYCYIVLSITMFTHNAALLQNQSVSVWHPVTANDRIFFECISQNIRNRMYMDGIYI